jgi:predicted alpha/beta superfamily hydrolase
VDDEYIVTVATPHGYDRSDATYPVIVVLDAHWLFGTVRDLAVSLSMGRAVPRTLVVGVGWPTTDLAEVARYRHRDATPTAATFPEHFTDDAGRYGVGRADRFRSFLLQELRPFLAERYRIGRPWLLVGHSLTGLFGVHTLLRAPTAFDAYLLASPSLWWDDRVTLRVSEPEVAGQRVDLPARVYLTAGAEEGRDERSAPFRMVQNVTELGRRLVRYDGLDLQLEILDGETHHSTLGQSVSRGLRALLGAGPTS